MKKEKVKAEEEERKPTLTIFIKKKYIRHNRKVEYVGGVHPEHFIGWGGPGNYI
jgi:hypothetical protein